MWSCVKILSFNINLWIIQKINMFCLARCIWNNTTSIILNRKA